MAKQPGITDRISDTEATAPQAGQSDLAPVVEALTQATQALVTTTNQLIPRRGDGVLRVSASKWWPG